jgi:hypothetical protein
VLIAGNFFLIGRAPRMASALVGWRVGPKVASPYLISGEYTRARNVSWFGRITQAM